MVLSGLVGGIIHMPLHAKVAGAATVAASGLGGLTIAGTVGGIVLAIIAVVGLAITVSMNNRTKQREYDSEIQAAYDRGRSSLYDELMKAQRDAEFWRGMALQKRKDD